MSQLHPPPRPARSWPADWPVHTHSLFCLHCDVPTKDTDLPSCVAKGLPPRCLSAPRLQLPVCRLAEPSTGVICLGGAACHPSRPSTSGPRPAQGSPLGPPSHLPLPLWAHLVWCPGELQGGHISLGMASQCPRDWRKALCAHLAHPDFHPTPLLAVGPRLDQSRPSLAHGHERLPALPATF